MEIRLPGGWPPAAPSPACGKERPGDRMYVGKGHSPHLVHPLISAGVEGLKAGGAGPGGLPPAGGGPAAKASPQAVGSVGSTGGHSVSRSTTCPTYGTHSPRRARAGPSEGEESVRWGSGTFPA